LECPFTFFPYSIINSVPENVKSQNTTSGALSCLVSKREKNNYKTGRAIASKSYHRTILTIAHLLIVFACLSQNQAAESQ